MNLHCSIIIKQGRVKKPLTAFENGEGFYQQSPVGSKETFKPFTKVANTIGKMVAFATIGLDILNTWTALSYNTNLQRLEKTGIQVGGAAISLSTGLLTGALAEAGIATSETGVGALLIPAAFYLDYKVAQSVEKVQNWAYNKLAIK